MRFAPRAQGCVSSYGAMHHHPDYVGLPIQLQLDRLRRVPRDQSKFYKINKYLSAASRQCADELDGIVTADA